MITSLLGEHLIERRRYLDAIEKYLGNPVVKVLTGMRRVGKSSILKSIIQKLVKTGQYSEETIFYLNKEDLTFDHIRTYADLHGLWIEWSRAHTPGTPLFLAIDEIQEIDEWERFITSVGATHGKQVEICITGSNSHLLSSELATYLTGRYVEFEIFPLDMDEYALFRKLPRSKELFLEYLKYGGLPGTLSMRQEEGVIFDYLRGIYSTILIKDIVARFGLRNIDFFENLYRYLFANIGHIFSAKSISDYLKSQRLNISTETILTYLQYGISSYLLSLVKAEDPIVKKYFAIYNKYYIGDLGLRNSLVGFNLARDIAGLLENYVYIELCRYGYSIHIGHLSNDMEIDFIAEKGGIRKYFQVTYLLTSETTITREYGSLESIKDNWEKYVVSMDDINFGVRNGIKHIQILDLHTVL